MTMNNTELIVELAKVKAIFQQRAICAAMGINLSNSTPLEYCIHCQEQHEDSDVFCDICGDHHKPDAIPYTCQTGDGV